MFENISMAEDGTLNTSLSEKATATTTAVCLCDGESKSSSSFFEGFDYLDGEFLTVLLGVITLLSSVVGYFVQRNIERKEEAAADQHALDNLDRQQALERVRRQLSLYVGPLHRLVKTQNTTIAQYRQATNKTVKFQTWMNLFHNFCLEPYLEDPMCLDAKHYRSFVIHQLKPIYERIRKLVLNHAADLAEYPTQEEYLKKYDNDEKVVMSPYVGSINVNVIFDTYCVWSYEFDDIVECWKEGDFSRMQPTTMVTWGIINYLADFMYDNAKEKEAKYNKHVKVHHNVVQQGLNTIAEVEEGFFSDEQEGTIRNVPKICN